MTYTEKEIRAAVVVAYTRNRAELEAIGGIMDDWPAPEDVPADHWDRDVDYILNDVLGRQGRVFTWYRLTLDGEVEEGVTCARVFDEDVYTTRPATVQEAVDFIFAGGMQEEDDGDYYFDQGWNAAKEGLTL